MRYVLGVDGGGTKTHALLVDESGRAAGFGAAGGSNYQTCGLAEAGREIGAAARAALGPVDQADLAYLCLAGADLAEDYAILEPAMLALGLARRVVVKNDTMAALGAGLTRSWGIAVVCGTGLNAVGLGPDGREVAFPSLGPISGDWGGGGDLSAEVIRAVMRAWDGRGQPTALRDRVLSRLGAHSEEDLLARLRHKRIEEPTILGLVPLLFEAADEGDAVARQLVTRMGVEIAASANALIRRLGVAAEEVEVVLSGSIFKGKGPLLIETVTAAIRAQAPTARISRVRYEPVVGAALLGLEALGVTLTAEVIARLNETITPLGLHLAPP